MRNFKKILSVTMVVVLVLSTVGCGKKESSLDDANKQTSETKADYIPDETVTLKILSQTCSYEGIQEGWFADVMLEKFNVKLDLSCYGMEESFMGDYDFILSGATGTDEFIEALNKGGFLSISKQDMAKYMPYINEKLTKHCLTDETGNVYAIKSSIGLEGDHQELFYTWDTIYNYYKELDDKEIENLDDWVNMLKQMKENHPTNASGDEIYGLTLFNDWNDDCLFMVKTFVTAYYGLDYYQLLFKDWKTGDCYGLLDNLNDGSYGPYLKILQLYNRLYKEGLLDPEFETRDFDSAVSMVENGQILVSLQNFMGSVINYDMFPVIPNDAKQIAYTLGQGHPNRTFSIDSETKYPELCMAILNYFYTPEGMLTMQYGPKGDCWDYDKEGNTYLTETGMKLFLRYDSVMDTYHDGFPMFNMSPYNHMATNTDNGEVFNPIYWKNTEPGDVTDLSNNIAVDRYMHEIKPYVVVPNYDFADLKESDLKDKYTAVSDIIITKSLEAIKASNDEEFDTIVKDMVTKANEAGYKECVEFTMENIKVVE